MTLSDLQQLSYQLRIIFVQKYVLGILRILKQVKERTREENKSQTKRKCSKYCLA